MRALFILALLARVPTPGPRPSLRTKDYRHTLRHALPPRTGLVFSVFESKLLHQNSFGLANANTSITSVFWRLSILPIGSHVFNKHSCSKRTR